MSRWSVPCSRRERIPAGRARPGSPSSLSYLRGGLGTLALGSIGDSADVNAKDAAGRTALHLAAEGGLDEVVKALLDKGADPDAADADGLTALAIAENWGSGAAAANLTAKGARPVRPKAHLLKGGAYEVVEPTAGAKTETAVIRYIGTDGFLIQAGSKSVLVDGLVRNPWGYTNTPSGRWP
ncbi:MAG: ankyrin repeat domain-containing protein [Desulfosudis oleivorans]|nr:ankyrin repeat domain-containing protein [Desulfosudis oleivorans]